ncbi:MAG: GTPase Era [Oligoflexia bacterium]|nr:MAG: GTPase Era [Oligoflexia bacterium]
MTYKAGFVGLIGQPNAGKSTLLNHLVEDKISIVTPKPQTTRRRVLGVVSRDQGQVVFVDSPGVLRTQKGLNAFLTKEAEDVIESSDALAAVVSIDEKKKDDVLKIINLVKESHKPWFVIITKVDLSEKSHRVEMVKDLVRTIDPKVKIIEFSSEWKKESKEIIQDVIQTSISLLPESKKPLYDVELFTPHSVRELVGEIVREKCFENLTKELPYQIAVRVTNFDESKKNLTSIFADIIVSKESHKPIVIGKGAATVKAIGMQARKEIEKLVGHKVFLKLDVVIRDNWFENPRMMKDLGYHNDRK